MKLKYYFMSVASALMLSNCAQEETPQSSQGNVKTLTATIEGSSRSAVTDGGVFSWTEGDAISVWNGESFTEFTRSNGNVFNSEEGITPSGVAIYPANSEHDYENSTVTVNLATEYDYGSTNAPMVAEIGSTALTFKHVGGLMRFIVKGMPETANSFTFTVNAGITGDFTVNEGVITAAEAIESNKSVTINFTQAQYNAESMTFYVPLPTGTYEGYTVTVGDKSNTTDDAVVNTIGRGTLLLMPTFTYTDTELVKGEGNTVVMEAEEQSMNLSGNQELVVEMPEGGIQDGVEAVLNLNYTPSEDATLSLSDGSEENAESSKESAATVNVTVPEDATIASLNVAMPSMTVSLNAAEGKEVTYTEVTALTAQNTLKIGKGVKVGKLIIKGGHIRLGGSITGEITRDADNADTVTYIILEEGVEAPANLPINVKVVNAAEYDLIKAIAAAEAGSIVTLESNVDLSESIVITKNLTVNLNNHYVKCASSDVFVVTGGTLTIEGEGTVWGSENNSSSSCAVWAKESGKVVINGGTYKVGHDGASKAAASLNWRNDCIYARDNASIEINGGEFMYTGEVDESNAQSNGHTFLLNLKDNGSASIVVKGGTFHKFNPAASNGENPVANFVAAGYSSVAGEDETYTVSEGILNEAALKAAIAAGTTSIKLGANIDLASSVEISSGNVIVNLNGNDIKCASSDVFVVTGGTLTIEGEGTVWGSENNSSSSCAVWAKESGKVVINGGTYKVGHDGASKAAASLNWRNDCIYARDNASIEINGGEFMYTGEVDESNAQSNGHTFLLNLKDNGSASIVVKGGTFHKFNPAASNGENPVANFVAAGYSSVAGENETYTVSEGILNEAALKAAIAAGTTSIKLGANFDLASSVEISSGNVIVNLNGNDIKCASSDVFVVTGGTLTIEGEGTVWGSENNSSSSCAIWAKESGKVVINGGTYKVGHDGASKAAASLNWRNDCIYARDNASIEINGGEFMYTGEVDESNAQSNGHTFLLNLKDNGSASIVVKGGTFHKFNPAASNGENPVANFVAAGYSSVAGENDTYVVTQDAN